MVLMGLEKGGYEFIGEAFVHGIMQGEALKDGVELWEDYELHLKQTISIRNRRYRDRQHQL